MSTHFYDQFLLEKDKTMIVLLCYVMILTADYSSAAAVAVELVAFWALAVVAALVAVLGAHAVEAAAGEAAQVRLV